jgi:hypothetical protein
MRIISRFRDYYDAVMKSGMDREVVYVRENKKITLTDPLNLDFTTEQSSSHHTTDLVFLGYCGQVYKIYVVTYATGHKYVFYDYEEFKRFMTMNKLAGMFDFDRSKWFPSRYTKFRDCDTAKFSELFHTYQVPLFVLSHVSRYSTRGTTTITLNPSLKELEFQTIKDPYTAYQDIFQYVAGTLNKPENKMVKISDKDKVHKHGFDKWSFRTMPGTKKPRKKK